MFLLTLTNNASVSNSDTSFLGLLIHPPFALFLCLIMLSLFLFIRSSSKTDKSIKHNVFLNHLHRSLHYEDDSAILMVTLILTIVFSVIAELFVIIGYFGDGTIPVS